MITNTFTVPITIAIGSSAAIGYSVVIQLFGSATYNSDGTVSGVNGAPGIAPNGTIYTYNPDSPDIHTTVTVQPNFVSDFAGFTQGSVHCTRDDIALRVYFRKDVSPNPNRIEIILELGHFTYDGSASNLGPFSLQILKAGVPQNIPVATTLGATWVPGGSVGGVMNVPTAYFPQLGWWTRWRWNPTPRPRIRTGAQLLPGTGNLNLVPNFSATQATAYGVVNCGSTGFSIGQSWGGTNGVVTAYSSAFAPGVPGAVQNNYNPVGVNEGCTIGLSMGGTGGRPELGVVTEWNANYIVNGNTAALNTTMVHGEVDGGIPWCVRDSTTNWAPVNFYSTPNVQYFPGHVNQGVPQADSPYVPEPSRLDGVDWAPDIAHTPLLSYIPYLLTGDPYFLENMQMMASFLIGANYYFRSAGMLVNEVDPNTPSMPGFPTMFPWYRYSTRGLAWTIRTYTACYLATPASVPSWLLPKTYFKSVLDDNQVNADSWGTNYDVTHPTLPQYPNLQAQGVLIQGHFYDEIFFLAYLMMAGGFALNQGGLSEWKPYLQWAFTNPFAYGNGTNGAPKTWPVPYLMYVAPFGTDYNGAPSAITNASDGLNFIFNNAMSNGTYNKGNTWSIGTLDYLPLFGAWVSGTIYHCNSWIVEMRGGCPVLPNVGDVCSVTISGSFTGSPVTVSHTVTSSDITTLTIAVQDLIGTLSNTSSGIHPVIDALIMSINANSVLSSAGIQANYTNSNSGVGSVGPAFGRYGECGRIWISFNSDGTSVTGGPVIGDIVITANMKTSTNNSMYASPNGDGVHFGIHNVACFNRSVCYQAGKSGTSTVAPSGTTPQALVGDLNWCYSPEFKSSPLIVPGGPSSTLPQIGWGGIYGNQPLAPNYVDWLRAGVAGCQTAGLTGASGAYTTWKSIFDHYNAVGYFSQFNFSMIP